MKNLQEGLWCYDRRKGGLVQERILGDGLLRLAYTRPGRLLCGWALFRMAFFSRLLGWYADSRFSCRRIAGTVSSLQIAMEDFEVPAGGFCCFNDFFTRRLRPGARDFSGAGVLSPADCRMTVWPELTDDTCIPVKGAVFTVPDLLGEEGAPYAERFRGGALCVARLCPADYHRFHFPAAGRVLKHWRVKGRYHSVSPVALHKGISVFPHNVREVSILELDGLGLCAYLEVGAFGVGSITQTHAGEVFARGDEKGYFSFGGSTVILIFEPQKISFSSDLTEHSSRGYETILKVGETIAEAVAAGKDKIRPDKAV